MALFAVFDAPVARHPCLRTSYQHTTVRYVYSSYLIHVEDIWRNLPVAAFVLFQELQ
jgi:hypothetical protein